MPKCGFTGDGRDPLNKERRFLPQRLDDVLVEGTSSRDDPDLPLLCSSEDL